MLVMVVVVCACLFGSCLSVLHACSPATRPCTRSNTGGVGVVLSPSHQEEGDGGEALLLLRKRLWLMIARHLIEVCANL